MMLRNVLTLEIIVINVSRNQITFADGMDSAGGVKRFNCCVLPGRRERMTGQWLGDSASARSKRLPRSADGTCGDAMGTDYGEEEQDPYRVQQPEASLGDAVHRSSGDIGQHQSTGRWIPSKSGYRAPITANQHDRDQTHSDPPEVEVNLDVTVVCFVHVHVLR